MKKPTSQFPARETIAARVSV